MRFASTVTTAVAISAASVIASPVRRQSDGLSACANVTQQYNQAIAANYTNIRVDGQLAYDCLNSMPFDSELASEYVLEITKYLQFQSTIPVLMNPPDTYLSPAVDLLGGLAAIYQKANTSQYQSQYQLDTEMNNLFFSANDGHLFVGFCSLSASFLFGQEFAIYSLSTDGLALPQLYLTTDVVAQTYGANVSDIVEINGQNATKYLEQLGLMQANQDPDAQYNDCFPSKAKILTNSLGSSGAFFINNGYWPGTPDITLTFSNGSTAYTRVFAEINTVGPFNYSSGDDLYAGICLPANATSPSSPSSTSDSDGAASATVNPTPTAAFPFYGTPIIRDPYDKINGYYINDTQFNDTAVLFIPDFGTSGEGNPDDEEATFAEVASTFVTGAVADGKTKIIIDVSGNPGGTITSGFNLFKLFFPDMEAYSATRMRDQPAEQFMIKAFAGLNDSNPDYSDLAFDNPFFYADEVTPDQNSSFATWEQFYGPDNINGANMTSLYANFNYTVQSTESEPLQGYGDVPTNFTSRPFAAENILIVSDGYCQSTCTTFVNLMTNPQFGGVKSLAFGGRPIYGPMQIMGGVRGAQSMGWDGLSQTVIQAAELAVNSTMFTQEELEIAMEVLPIPLADFPLQLTTGNLNLRNAYNPDNDEIPLQFQYQAADCKLFYTAENVLLPASQWVSAANAVWGNGGCVYGSVPTNSTN